MGATDSFREIDLVCLSDIFLKTFSHNDVRQYVEISSVATPKRFAIAASV
jgi:hypothetical protein